MRIVTGGLLLVAMASPCRAGELELRRVMLSSAGTGYFEYEATVDGTATLGLDVKLGQVDDVLKSLVVFDSAGAVGAVTLPGRDPGEAAFGRVPFGPDSLAAPASYLNALQGVEVSVTGPRPMRGRIMGAETVREPPPGPGQQGRTLTRVSLLTAGGLQQFVLEDSEAVQVEDAGLRDRIAEAVAGTRRETARETRHLSIASVGPAGTRAVRVSYVAVAPLWKASYRLVLPTDDTGTAQARLQGWGTLENDSGADWSGVSLSLQYGNPVTFHQAIYRSYFVQRPEVPVEVLGRLLPDVDTRARPIPAPMAARAMAPPAPPPTPAPMMTPVTAMAKMAAEPPPGMAETAAADAQESASETVFTPTEKLELPAGHSATVPILDVSLPATRVALATPGQLHPLDTIRIANTSGTSLPAGVLTLYDLRAPAPYAGDARLGGVPTGESRLISYGQDLRTNIEWREQQDVALASLTVADGVLTVDERTRHITHAIVSAPAQTGRRVLIDVRKPPDTVIAPGFATPAEQTATTWRFAADIPAGAVQEITYALDSHETRTVSLLDDGDAVAAVMSLPGASPAATAALQRVTGLREREAAATAARDRLAAQREAIEADETRLRENLKALQPGDALRTRLLQRLDDDERRLADLGKAAEAADGAVAAAHRALADAVAGLKL